MLAVLSPLLFPGSTVRPTGLDCPVRDAISQLPRLSLFGCPILAVLSLLPFPGRSASVSYPGFTIPSVFSDCTVQALLFQLSCPGCPVPAVLPLLSCPNCPIPAVLSRLSCHSCPVPAVLYRLSCHSCPVLAVLFRPSCPSFPLLAALPRQPCS